MAKIKKRASGSVLLSRKPNTGSSLSRKAGRTLIRTHHTLHKQLAQALARNDHAAAELLRQQIDANGGLEKYQKASINGQSSQRGGDSSKQLVHWLAEAPSPSPPASAAPGGGAGASATERRLLEIGCLSPDNAVSKSRLFASVARIDLHSQHPSIETQDFMQRPLPGCERDKFDLISLSLVLNYVADPAERGEMLRRTALFLRASQPERGDRGGLFPSLFLVLPLPCIANSRYLDEKLLAEMMASLGYVQVKRKLSPKLMYGLWRLDDHGAHRREGLRWKKEEVNPGRNRNNFAITLK